jgi:hypothetical protein
MAGVRAPSRWVLWWNVAAAAGAGIALRSWRVANAEPARSPRWVLAAAIVAAVVGSSFLDPAGRRAAAVSAVVAAIALLALRAGWRARSMLAAWAIVAIAALDLSAFASSIPLGLPRFAFPDPGFPVRWLADAAARAAPGDPHARVLVVPRLRYANAAPFAAVPVLQGYSRVVPSDFLALLLGPRGRKPRAESRLVMDDTLAAPSSHVLDLLRCRVVVCDERLGGRSSCPYAARIESGDPRWEEIPRLPGSPVRLFMNRRARPVAWLVQRARVLPSETALRAIREDPGFDPAREALLEALIPGAPLQEASGAAEAGPVEVLQYADDEIRLAAAPAELALLVTSELAYPGWVATVDGRPAALYTVNTAFRAVVVSPGRHEIVLSYRPTIARVGLGLSAAGLLALLACALAAARSRADATIELPAPDCAADGQGQQGEPRQ